MSEGGEVQASEQVTPEDRKEILGDRVAAAVRNGYAVESQTDYQAVMVKGKRPNHLLHFFLSVFTVFIWAIFVWIPLAIFKHEKRMVIAVDQDGNATQISKSGR